MKTFEMFKLYQSFQSYQQAKAEGHLTQWFFKEGLLWFLKQSFLWLLRAIQHLIQWFFRQKWLFQSFRGLLEWSFRLFRGLLWAIKRLMLWFAKKSTILILKMIVKVILLPITLLIIPLKWIWNRTGQDLSGIYHLIRFSQYAFIYIIVYIFLWYVIFEMLFGTSSSPVTQ